LWKCLVGNKDKWRKKRETLELSVQREDKTVALYCDYVSDDADTTIVRFSWTEGYSFYEILEIFGSPPIPPYLHRNATEQDVDTYQTVYAEVNGAVAAPTAGFHFTPGILDQLKKKGIKEAFVTLHVSAGTFKPIKKQDVTEHPMHSEQVIIDRSLVELLLQQDRNTVCVGTTSLRTLESLYWFGVKLLKEDPEAGFIIEKLLAYKYEAGSLPSKKESLEAVLKYMGDHNKQTLTGDTSIFIFPPYNFKMCDILITNYHMPGSTLILLVAAFAGPGWRNIYNEALNNNYRFLSYGDSSVLFRC
jgi:S-adenosylmethionine:tRNA ribosyltransferase-isomerase